MNIRQTHLEIMVASFACYCCKLSRATKYPLLGDILVPVNLQPLSFIFTRLYERVNKVKSITL